MHRFHSPLPYRLRPLFLVVLGACAQQAVLADAKTDAQKDSSKTEQPATELSTITVTARRSAEQVKDLPFTVNVVDGDKIEARRLNTLEDVLRSTPGVEITTWGGVENANVRIRGVGSLYQVSRDDTAVVVNIDGVPTSVGNTGLGTLDVEQVEVLKGPQGTLFGRGSEAGAINVRTRRPTRSFEASLRGELGTRSNRLGEAMISGPLSETLAGRLAIRANGQDYPTYNRMTGKPVSRPNDVIGRASLLWQPSAATEVLLRASQHTARKYVNGMVLRPYGRRTWQDYRTPSPNDSSYYRVGQYVLDIRHDLSWARLSSVTSQERIGGAQQQVTSSELVRAWMGVDGDLPQQYARRDRSWNQDFRLSSLPGSQVFWVAGVNIYRSKRKMDNSFLAQSGARNFTHKTEALYGEATVPLPASFKLTAGLRHTRERKGYRAEYVNGGLRTPDARQLHESHTTGRIGLSRALSPQTNVYGMLARGHKAGGFNDYALQPSDSRPYRPGRVDSLEVGIKHEAAGGDLRVNGALFFNRVRDDHLLAYDANRGFSSWTVNVDTQSKGAEVDMEWRAGGGFTLSGGLAFIDGKITTGAVTNTPGGNVRAGNRLPDVPRWSGLLAVRYQRALPAFWGMTSPTLDARLSARLVGQRTADAQNNFDLRGYQKLDLRIGISGGSTEFYLWGENLLNQRYDQYGYFLKPGVTAGMPARGRSVGIGLTHYF